MKGDKQNDEPITLELCDRLVSQLKDAINQLPRDRLGEPDWDLCRNNWIDSLCYARRRLGEVKRDLEASRTLTRDYHGKIIHNCRCVIRDYIVAKDSDFRRES